MSDDVKALALFLKLSQAADASDFIAILGDVLDTAPEEIQLLDAEQVGVIQALFGADASVIQFLTERGLIGGDGDGESSDAEESGDDEAGSGPDGPGSALFTLLMGVDSASELVDQILSAGAEAVGSQLSGEEIDAIISRFLGDSFFLGFLESNGVSTIELQGPAARATALDLVSSDPSLTLDDLGRVINAVGELMVFTPAGSFVKAPSESLRVLGEVAEDTEVVLPPAEVEEDSDDTPVIDDPLDQLGPDDPKPGETPLEPGLDHGAVDAGESVVPPDTEIPDDPGSEVFVPDAPIEGGDTSSDSASLVLVGIPPAG